MRQHFDTVARKYDLMNTLLSFGLHHLWKRTAVRLLGLKPGDRVLDVCGGTADLALLAARAVGPNGRIVVYDINRAMMEAGLPKVAQLRPGPPPPVPPGRRRAPGLPGRAASTRPWWGSASGT